MHIEKEIPENYFRNANHKTIVNIVFTSNWLHERLRDILEAEDITPQQYNIVRILHLNNKPMSTLKIREQMLDKMSDTSRIVERLLKKELVTKQVSAHDKRLVDVSITPKGEQLLQKIEKKTGQVDSIVSKLTDQECNTLNSLLDKIREKD